MRNDSSKIVHDKEKASDGEYCARVESSKDAYTGIDIQDKAVLKRFKDVSQRPLFKMDVYNPQSEPISFGITMTDPASTSWGTKHNGSATVAPGKSTIEVNLTGLNRSNGKGNMSTDLVDPAKLTGVSIFMGPGPKPIVLYFDNLRLEPSPLPTIPGLKAIDFGPKGTPVYPGFTACTEKDVWSDKADFGWVNPGQADNCQQPDALTGTYGSGEAFKMKLPNGKYEIQTCLDPLGNARFPTWSKRQVIINGKEVLSETMDSKQFLDKYYMNEDNEDLPGQNLWQKFIVPRDIIRTFEAEVTDGVLSVQVKSPDKHGRWICFLVCYPEAQKEQGRKWMDTLGKLREEKFNKKIVFQVAKPDGDEVAPTEKDKERGFVPFVRHSELDIAVTARPAKDELLDPKGDPEGRTRPVRFEGAAGQRCSVQIGLYPLKEVKRIRIGECGDLCATDGKNSIFAAELEIKRVRNFFKRPGRLDVAPVLPYILQHFDTLDLTPGITRGLWVTLTIPNDTPPGRYTGIIEAAPDLENEDAQDEICLRVPVEVTVLPFKLDKVTDIPLTVTGATSYGWHGWYKDLDELWWKGGEMVVKDLAAHGMNAIDGGPGARLVAVKDGKATIDYSEYDRWMDMAVKAGLTMPGDTYAGLDVWGVPHYHDKDCVTKSEQESQSQYGMSFSELMRIVYGDFDKHNKEKGYPRRSHHLLDEPRPEWGNIEPAAELIRLCTQACPDSLFSGYYTTGAGRDVYFQTMPISISHTNKLTLKLTKDAGKTLWDYDGENVRHNIGRFLYVASRAGLGGYQRNGYIYVCSDPYFDFSADEASWCVVYPGRNGLNGTCGWERTGEGVTDYRYLAMCERLIKKARTEGKAAKEADAAEAYMKETLKAIDIEKRQTAKLTPAGYDEFRHALAGHITALMAALGDK
jgi:hypothetical protein